MNDALWTDKHSLYCGCWLCQGRPPDGRFLEIDPDKIPCTNCGELTTADLHGDCWTDWLALINNGEALPA